MSYSLKLLEKLDIQNNLIKIFKGHLYFVKEKKFQFQLQTLLILLSTHFRVQIPI